MVDLAFEPSKTVMSSRAVSADPKQAVLYAREFLQGLRAARVIGSAKHFPGLGEANLDTHQELPSINKPWKKLWAEDLYPYRVLRRELPMVLIGHANYPAITHDRSPASLSRKWITDVLRKKIGYRGLVVSDDLEMGGVLKAAPIEQAAVEHVRAGGDLCLICHIEEYVTRSYETLIKEAEKQPQVCATSSGSPPHACWPSRRNSAELKRRPPAPTQAKLEKLSRQVWELERAGPPGQTGSGDLMIVAGIMSGTSADGINVALIQLVWRGRPRPRVFDPSKLTFRFVAQAEYPYPKAVRQAVLQAMNARKPASPTSPA